MVVPRVVASHAFAVPRGANTASNNASMASPSVSWPTKDIVYISIMIPVMLAAFLEWFLFLAAFLYCLFKVFRKAEQWSVRAMALTMTVIFTAMRFVFLPVMIVTLPLPQQITKHFPEALDSALSWFAFYTFASLLTVPFLVCLWQIILKHIGRKKMITEKLDEKTAPKTVVVMPVYKEDPQVLLTAIDSVVVCDYPPQCLHVFLSFDGDQEDELYLKTLENLGIPLTLRKFHESMDVVYRSVRVTVSKFPHGGKRKCQKQTFKLINKIYEEYLKRHDNLFVLFIDSDCILDRVCIQNFMYEMELKEGSGPERLAMTGIITSKTDKHTFITLLQDMEYVHGQLFERTVESACGSVTCLPGALTMLRVSAFRKMAKYYFADKAEQCDDLFDFAKCHLGEDRWLTHLFMVGAKHRYQVQMCTTSFCKTEAVQTFRSLLKQRRRWFLGYITNEACMLTDIRLWKMYPFLCIVRLAQSTIRTTALLFFVMVLSVVSGEQSLSNLPVGFIAISLGLNWLMMLYFGVKLERYKIWLYPVMFVANPFFNWIYMVYGIFTAGQRTWGGPRADAGAADAHTTPQEAIEHAAATGDDLNIIPETFKPSTLVRHPTRRVGVPLQPSDHLEGRFAPAEQNHSGVFIQSNDSGMTFPNMLPRDPGFSTDLPYDSQLPPLEVSPRARDSWYSFISDSESEHIPTPRRVESLLYENPPDFSDQESQPSHQPSPLLHPLSRDEEPPCGPSPEPPTRHSSRRNGTPTTRSNRKSHGKNLQVPSATELAETALEVGPANGLSEPLNPYARYRTSRPSPLSQRPVVSPYEEEIEALPLPPPILCRAEPSESSSQSIKSGRNRLQKRRET